jgi:hypothetical protein
VERLRRRMKAPQTIKPPEPYEEAPHIGGFIKNRFRIDAWDLLYNFL